MKKELVKISFGVVAIACVTVVLIMSVAIWAAKLAVIVDPPPERIDIEVPVRPPEEEKPAESDADRFTLPLFFDITTR